jgi:sterol desaturase/sphingolipid hydroxylase (fatty acid hydroxylase superfamily)
VRSGRLPGEPLTPESNEVGAATLPIVHGENGVGDARDAERSARTTVASPWRVEQPPLLRWPIRPAAIVRWCFGFPGYLLPYNLLYLAVTALAWWVATPSRQTMAHLSFGWIALLLARNAVVLGLWFGLAHLRLYTRRAQDARSKFNPRWPSERSDRFTFGSQLRDNVWWTLVSGLPIWTAWEVVTLWLFANGRVKWLSFSQHPVWFVVLLVLIPLYREVHFYAVHRLIHWPPLYRRVHSLHHRNTNPGPWSGLSMHPVEHLAYFSAVAVHWLVPSHPIHAMYTAFHLAMAPVPGHCGFELVELGERSLPTGGYAHYLHHKYFEVNYSDGAIPLDRWFGSFHDGSPEADEAMKRRRAHRRAPLAPVD